MTTNQRQGAFQLAINDEELFDLYQHIPYRVAITSNLLAIDRDAKIGQQTQLQTREIRVLLNVGSYGPINAADVAYQSRLDPYSVNRAINSLLQAGYIEAASSADKQRSKPVQITAAGQLIYDKVVLHMQQRQTQLMQGITAQEQAQLLQLLEKLELNAEQMLANHVQQAQLQGQTVTRDQKELLRWQQRTEKMLTDTDG
ncbi:MULTISPECIES: MarR family transcriptional regulator [Shewanella]|uniref:MarR family transcriptional regulator n=1 Tax=Shewanella TaxID=22 RepID=UPI00048A96FD|nr:MULTISPECIES: MarR family transcriptional regulator [Shewanella]QLE85863.1 MarR family transcriptional regulator [Shewanella sp. Scap07]